MNKVLLFNPRSANTKPRIPNSILSIAAAIEGLYGYVIVDGNQETDPWQKINSYLATGEYGYFGCTCMPGPQLRQAIPFSKQIRTLYPAVKIIWGGYFPSNQPKVVLQSGFVDVIVNGPGEKCFPALLQALNNGQSFNTIPNLIYRCATVTQASETNCGTPGQNALRCATVTQPSGTNCGTPDSGDSI
jgi:anaerobic magnesium-protoporphyrin IX monomethyl ester cyclase